MHDLTPWPRISEVFPNNLFKMVENVSIDWVKHPKLDWEYVTVMLEKKGNSCGPHFNLSRILRNYALFVAPHLDQKVHGF